MSRRAVAAVIAWGASTAAALLFGCALPLPLKAAAVLLLGTCLWRATSDLAGRRGRLELGTDGRGRWWLRRGRTGLEYVQFGAPPLVLGNWVWLRLRGDAARTFLFIDGAIAEPGAFRRLKVILHLHPGGSPRALKHRDRRNC